MEVPDQRARLERLVKQEPLGRPELLERLERQDRRVLLARQALREELARPVHPGRPGTLAHLVVQEQLVQLDLRAQLALLGNPGPRE
jgi:hypothetical protein